MVTANAKISEEDASKLVYNCALSFAHETIGIDADFAKLVTIKDYDEQTCKVLVDELISVVYEIIAELYVKDSFYENNADCIVEKLKELGADDQYILRYVYTLDKNLTALRRKKNVREVEHKIAQKLDLAEDLCLPVERAAQWFDQLYELDDNSYTVFKKTGYVKSIEELEEAYCIKNSLAEKNFTNEYTINENPSNLDVTHINCTAYLKEKEIDVLSDVRLGFINGIKDVSAKQKVCIGKIIRDSGVVDMIYKVWTLGDLKLEAEYKAKERTLFAEFYEKVQKEVMECVA